MSNIPFDNRLPELLGRYLSSAGCNRHARVALEPDLSYGRYNGPAPHNARQAAVVALIYPDESDWSLPLTLRPVDLKPHGGQISLPGGVIEREEGSQQAALRELDEELGVPSAEVTIVGPLTELYIPASNFVVKPWIAAAREAPHWKPHAVEVAAVLQLPLGHLIDQHSIQGAMKQARGVDFHAPHIAWNGHEIWGATSMILAEFKNILQTVVSQ